MTSRSEIPDTLRAGSRCWWMPMRGRILPATGAPAKPRANWKGSCPSGPNSPRGQTGRALEGQIRFGVGIPRRERLPLPGAAESRGRSWPPGRNAIARRNIHLTREPPGRTPPRARGDGVGRTTSPRPGIRIIPAGVRLSFQSRATATLLSSRTGLQSSRTGS